MKIRELRFKKVPFKARKEHPYRYFLDQIIEHNKVDKALIASLMAGAPGYENKLLEIMARGRIIHLAEGHNRFVYSIESLFSKGIVPAGVTVYMADNHDDFGVHFNGELPWKGVIYARTKSAQPEDENEKEGIFWDHSTVCCDPTNYLAYLSWYSLIEKTMPFGKQFIYLVKDEKTALETLGVSPGPYQRVIFQDSEGVFYYCNQIPIEFQNPNDSSKLRDFDAYFKATLQSAEALKSRNADIPLDHSWVYDRKGIGLVRKNFESGIKRYRDSQKLTMNFPLIFYGDNQIIPELPCVTNLDLDCWLNMSGITQNEQYKDEIDLFYNRCNGVLRESPLIFIALSKVYTTKNRKKIPTIAQCLVERICDLPQKQFN